VVLHGSWPCRSLLFSRTYGGPEQLHAVPESRRHGQYGLFGFVLHAPRYDEIETVVQSLLELGEP
jgi:hypothetical protein